MPQPLPIDRDEVRQTAIALGSLTEASKAHNIPLGTVKAWAKRYNWMTTARIQKTIQDNRNLLKTPSETVCNHSATRATIPSKDALSEVISDAKDSFHKSMSKALKKGARHLEQMEGEEILGHSRKIKDLADTGKVILGIGSEQDKPQVNVAILGLSLNFNQTLEEMETIDVKAEKVD